MRKISAQEFGDILKTGQWGVEMGPSGQPPAPIEVVEAHPAGIMLGYGGKRFTLSASDGEISFAACDTQINVVQLVVRHQKYYASDTDTWAYTEWAPKLRIDHIPSWERYQEHGRQVDQRHTDQRAREKRLLEGSAARIRRIVAERKSLVVGARIQDLVMSEDGGSLDLVCDDGRSFNIWTASSCDDGFPEDRVRWDESSIKDLFDIGPSA